MIRGCFWGQLAGAEKSWMSRMVDVKKTKRENASRLMKTIVNNKTVGGEIRVQRCCERLCTQDWTWNSQWEAAIIEGNDNVDGDNVISLSSDDLATDPSHSTHHTAHLPLKQQRLSSAIISFHCMGGSRNCPKLTVRYHWEAIFFRQSKRIQQSKTGEQTDSDLWTGVDSEWSWSW